MTLLESTWNRKFWERVSATPDGCWLWLGKLNSYGYGITSRGGRRLMAHRVAYEQRVGPIPPALVLDHLCRTRACCNPQHLEPVTIGENVRRGDGPSSRTCCPQGHAYDAENTYTSPTGERTCRTCHRTRERERAKARATCPVCGMERQARRLSAHIRRMHTERTEP